MQFMLGRTRVRILAQHLAGGGGILRRATMTMIKGHSIVFPVKSHEKNIYRTKQNNLFIKTIFMAILSAFSEDSDEVLAWNLIMPTLQAFGQSQRSSSWICFFGYMHFVLL